MSLAPAAAALLAGELACIYGFFDYALRTYPHKGDAWLHCWTSCKIATWCPPGFSVSGPAIAALVGALKELLDITIGSAEVRDMINNFHGIGCSTNPFKTCHACCEEARASGRLARAEGPAETPALAATSTGRADTGLTGADAAALARGRAGAAAGMA